MNTTQSHTTTIAPHAVGEDRRQRFDRIVAVHIPVLTRVALRRYRHREFAEDVVQETLLRAWRHLDQLRDAESARAWLFMIMRNESARAFHKAPPLCADIDVDTLVGASNAMDMDAIELREGVKALPEKYRGPLELFTFGGYSVEEIASTLGLESATVKTRLCRARGQLHGLLTEARPTPG